MVSQRQNIWVVSDGFNSGIIEVTSFTDGLWLNHTLLAIQFRSIPIHVIFFVENFENLMFPERQLVVGGRVEVVLGYRLHDDSGVVLFTPPSSWCLSLRDVYLLNTCCNNPEMKKNEVFFRLLFKALHFFDKFGLKFGTEIWKRKK